MEKYILSLIILSLCFKLHGGVAFDLPMDKKSEPQTTSPSRENQAAPPSASENCPGNLYLGHYDNAGYEIGLLVCLDSESKIGTTFLPPSMERLSDVRWTADGLVNFTSASPARPIHFSFDGKATGSAIEGTIKLNNTGTKEIRETHAKLSLLEKPWLKTSGSQRYSNAEYNEDAGDLVGADLILLSENEGSTGVMSFYVGYWGEPGHVPLFVSNVRKSRDGNFAFSLSFEAKSKEYVAKRTPSGLIIAPSHLETWEVVRKITLKRNQRLIPDLFPPAQ